MDLRRRDTLAARCAAPPDMVSMASRSSMGSRFRRCAPHTSAGVLEIPGKKFSARAGVRCGDSERAAESPARNRRGGQREEQHHARDGHAGAEKAKRVGDQHQRDGCAQRDAGSDGRAFRNRQPAQALFETAEDIDSVGRACSCRLPLHWFPLRQPRAANTDPRPPIRPLLLLTITIICRAKDPTAFGRRWSRRPPPRTACVGRCRCPSTGPASPGGIGARSDSRRSACAATRLRRPAAVLISKNPSRSSGSCVP